MAKKQERCGFHMGAEFTCQRPKGHVGACTTESVWRIPQFHVSFRYKGQPGLTELSPVNEMMIDQFERAFRKKKKYRFNYSNAIFVIDFSEVSAIICQEVKFKEKQNANK